MAGFNSPNKDPMDSTQTEEAFVQALTRAEIEKHSAARLSMKLGWEEAMQAPSVIGKATKVMVMVWSTQTFNSIFCSVIAGVISGLVVGIILLCVSPLLNPIHK